MVCKQLQQRWWQGIAVRKQNDLRVARNKVSKRIGGCYDGFSNGGGGGSGGRKKAVAVEIIGGSSHGSGGGGYGGSGTNLIEVVGVVITKTKIEMSGVIVVVKDVEQG